MNRQHKFGIAVVLVCMLVCSGVGVAAQGPGESGSPTGSGGVRAVPKPKVARVDPNQPLPVSPPQSNGGSQPPSASENPPSSNPGPANQGPSGPGPSNPQPSISGPSGPDQLPPHLPPSVVPQSATPTQPQEGRTSAQTNMAAQVLINKVGKDRVQQILNSVRGEANLQSANGQGAPTADVYFDGAHLRSSGDDVTVPGEQTHFFQGGGGSTPVPVDTTYKPTTHEDTVDIAKKYVSQPGGVVLEGQADLGPIDNIVYDSRFNALVVDDRGVYFLKIAPDSTAELCRAIAQQDQIGVSLGAVHISYGSLPKTTRVAHDLMLADHFLGDIAFGWKKWTAGYKYANGYEPQQFHGSVRAAVFFRFSGFKFQVEQQQYTVSKEKFTDQYVPLSNQVAPDGGAVADDAAVDAGNVPSEYENNLVHIAKNIDYYRHEVLIDQTFSYGETAAFLRGLKAQGVDLDELADAVVGQH